jgi:hypothetical protein
LNRFLQKRPIRFWDWVVDPGAFNGLIEDSQKAIDIIHELKHAIPDDLAAHLVHEEAILPQSSPLLL